MFSRQSGFLLILLSAACFGFLPTTLRSIYASSDLKPIDVALWRYLVAVPLIVGFILVQRSRPREIVKAKQPPVPMKTLLFLGVVYATSVLIAFFGLERLPVAVFMLLMFTNPALIAVVMRFFGKPLSRAGWLALLLTLIGASLTLSASGEVKGVDASGIFLALLQVVSVASYYMLSGYLLQGSNDNARNTAWILTGTLLTLLLLVPFFGLKFPTQLPTWLGLVVLGSVCTGLPIFAMNAGIQRVGAAQAGIVSSVELVFSTTLAFIFLGEAILPLQIFGAAFIISAVILLQFSPDIPAELSPQPVPASDILD